MRIAAYVAGTFNIDPIRVLKSDFIDWQIYVQAANYFNEEMKKQQDKAQG